MLGRSLFGRLLSGSVGRLLWWFSNGLGLGGCKAGLGALIIVLG